MLLSNANWSAYKDSIASFSTNCGATAVPTIGAFATVQIIPNPANGFVTIKGFNNIQKIELIGRFMSITIKDLNQFTK